MEIGPKGTSTVTLASKWKATACSVFSVPQLLLADLSCRCKLIDWPDNHCLYCWTFLCQKLITYHYWTCCSSCCREKGLRLHRFISDRDEIWWECSSSKYALVTRVRFPIWRYTFKIAAMTWFHTEKCCHLVIAYTTFAGRICISVRQLPASTSVYSSWSIVHSCLLAYRTHHNSLLSLSIRKTPSPSPYSVVEEMPIIPKPVFLGAWNGSNCS